MRQQGDLDALIDLVLYFFALLLSALHCGPPSNRSKYQSSVYVTHTVGLAIKLP